MASTSVEDLHCLMHSLDSDMQQLSTDVPFCEEQRAKYLTYMEFEVRACIENAWSLLHKLMNSIIEQEAHESSYHRDPLAFPHL
ncbi:hypothetical protein AAC387_Pa05g1195 [Persea americana]